MVQNSNLFYPYIMVSRKHQEVGQSKSPFKKVKNRLLPGMPLF